MSPGAVALAAAVRQAIDRGLIEEADVVRGDLRVSASARRNSNLRLVRRHGPSYWIKQLDAEAHGVTGAAEARFYRYCADEPRLAPLTAIMPKLAATFDQDSVLVLELVENARSLWSAYREQQPAALPCLLPQLLGRALGSLHALFRDPESQAALPFGADEATPPSYFDLHRPRPSMLREASPARLELARCLQQEAAIGQGLEAARAGWRFDTVIHGDIRSENLLVVAGAGAESPSLRLIDWEFVQLGDPAWDVAAAFEDHVRFWLASMSQLPKLDANQRVATAAYPLATLHPLFRSLWDGYREAAGLDARSEADLLRRTVLFSGARLVQTAWERCRDLEQISSLSVLLVQLSANLLADPQRATRELYGLGGDH